MKFKGIKASGYKRLASLIKKKAAKAPLPGDPQGMADAAQTYARQMEQFGLPQSDPFWEQLAAFQSAAQAGDELQMGEFLSAMSEMSKAIVENPDKLLGLAAALRRKKAKAPLPTDPQGMMDAAQAYVTQMEQFGLPRNDSFWDAFADFQWASETEDTSYMAQSLGMMSDKAKKVVEAPERYLGGEEPTFNLSSPQPDLMTSVKPGQTRGLSPEKLRAAVDQAVAQWEEEVATHEQDPYTMFWDDLASFNEALEFEDFDNAIQLHDKLVNFKDNYGEAQKLPESESEALNFDYLKSGRKVAIPMQRRSPKPRRDQTLSLLEEILGKPVKKLYDEEGDLGDEGEDWLNQDPDFGRGPSKMSPEEPVFDVEIDEDEELEEEFVPEVKKVVDPFEM